MRVIRVIKSTVTMRLLLGQQGKHERMRRCKYRHSVMTDANMKALIPLPMHCCCTDMDGPSFRLILGNAISSQSVMPA